MEIGRRRPKLFKRIVRGIPIVLGAVVFALFTLPRWLVVDQQPEPVDAIIVPGGGDGRRLRHAMNLYDQQIGPLLILVGEESRDWQYILNRHGWDRNLDHRNHVVINGSQNTMTDAELVRDYIDGTSLKSLLVVTDPYHTRRADIQFKRALPGINVYTVSSGDYKELRNPDELWWRDGRTFKTVWMEARKNFYVLVKCRR